MSCELVDIDFDEEKWEDLINSEEFLETINTNGKSNIILHEKDILKLSRKNFQNRSFITTNQFLHLNNNQLIMIILNSPSRNQRVRYENECKNILRYISIPDNKNLTIKIPDLRNILLPNDVLWMRITRTTIPYKKDNLIFYHPYPIWIRNKTAKIHNGSIFIPIVDQNMQHGFIQINTLAMIRLKQDDLAKVNTLPIYSPNQLDFTDQHLIEITKPKFIRDEYKLQQSILNFQIVRIDKNNIAYPTNCICQTDILYEVEANGQQQKFRFNNIKKIQSTKIIKRKNI